MVAFFITLALTMTFLAIVCLAFRLGYKVGHGDGFTEKDSIATNECRTCILGQVQQAKLKQFHEEQLTMAKFIEVRPWEDDIFTLENCLINVNNIVQVCLTRIDKEEYEVAIYVVERNAYEKYNYVGNHKENFSQCGYFDEKTARELYEELKEKLNS